MRSRCGSRSRNRASRGCCGERPRPGSSGPWSSRLRVCTLTSRTRCARPSSCATAVVVDGDTHAALGAATAQLSRRHGRRGRPDRDRVLERDADGRGRRDAVADGVARRGGHAARRRSRRGAGACNFGRPGLTARLADLTGARAVPLPAPGLLRSATLREALVEDPAVAGVMASYERLTLALVGIGGLEPSGVARAERERDLRRRGRPFARARRGRRHLLPLLRRARGRAGLRARRARARDRPRAAARDPAPQSASPAAPASSPPSAPRCAAAGSTS